MSEVTKKAPSKKTTKAKVEKVSKKEVTNEEVVEQFEATTKFVYMNKVESVLDVSLATGKNCILHGKGGYGKSEFTLAYFRERDIEPYVITMGSGMTTDRLFGGVDLMSFNETGKIEYLIENSFMNHEYVIFEELFDAPDFILEQLKDILSAGIFRNGSQVFEIKTKIIICCTNKTREEFAKNTSLKALMERFPLELAVGWDDHNRLTYQNLLETKFGKGNADPLLTFTLEQFAKKGQVISPRIALVAATVMAECGPDCLEFIADFNSKDDILKDAKEKFKSIALIAETCHKLDELKEEIQNLIDEGLGTQEECNNAGKINAAFHKSINALSRIKADDTLAVSTANKVKKYQELHKKFSKSITITEAISEDFMDSIS